MVVSPANIINLHTVDIKSWIKEPNNIYIGRRTSKLKASKWRNPFRINHRSSRKRVVRQFEVYIRKKRNLVKLISELEGKTLGCWCAPKLCHAQILHKLAGNKPVYQSRSGFKNKYMDRENNMNSEKDNETNMNSEKDIVTNMNSEKDNETNMNSEKDNVTNMISESFQESETNMNSESFQQEQLNRELTNVLQSMSDIIEKDLENSGQKDLFIGGNDENVGFVTSGLQPPIPPVDATTPILVTSTIETNSVYESLLQPNSPSADPLENVSARSDGEANPEAPESVNLEAKVDSLDSKWERFDIQRRIINLQLQQLSKSSHSPSLLSPSRNLVNGRRHSLPSLPSLPLDFELADTAFSKNSHSVPASFTYPSSPTKKLSNSAPINSTHVSPPNSFTYDTDSLLSPTVKDLRESDAKATQRILDFLASKVDQLAINVNTIQYNLNQISDSLNFNQTVNASIPDTVKSLEESMEEKFSYLENKLDFQKINFDIELEALREENANLRNKLDNYILHETDREEKIKECFNSPLNVPNCIVDLQPLKENLEEKILELDIRLVECEQYSRRENIVISGIPNTVSQKDLQQKVIEILDLIGLKIIPDDIAACHRLYNPPGSYFPAKVIVRFGNRKIANFCLEHRDDLQQKAYDHFHWNLRFFESLCSKNEETMRICKSLSQQRKIHDYYLRSGFVKVVAHENGRPEKIKHPDLLRKKFDIPSGLT